MAHDNAGTFDPTDPHGFHADDTHGHVILSPFTLISVLVALMIFTILTVFASRFEVWAAEAFNMEIPQWVNVVIAMSFAVIKGVLVLMFFMQLKYDTPLNSIIFITCLLAFACFIGFTAIDLFSRDSIDREREGEIQVGGMITAHERYEQVLNQETGEWERKAITLSGKNMPIAEWAKTRERGPDEKRVTDHHEDEVEFSSANKTVRLTGLHLFALKHEDGHGSHGDESHDDAHDENEHDENAPGENAHEEDSGDGHGDEQQGEQESDG